MINRLIDRHHIISDKNYQIHLLKRNFITNSF
jgi:hypothetical protein